MPCQLQVKGNMGRGIRGMIATGKCQKVPGESGYEDLHDLAVINDSKHQSKEQDTQARQICKEITTKANEHTARQSASRHRAS